MKKMSRLLLVFSLLLLVGCGKSRHDFSKEYLIYTPDKDENRVDNYEVSADVDGVDATLQFLINELRTVPEKTTDKAAIPEGVEVKKITFIDDQVILDFSAEYHEMNPIQEVLSRAAIVRTLCQLDEVSYVTFLVEDDPLLNGSGMPVGLMNGEQFVDNAGNEINSYEKAELSLYFANTDGNALMSVVEECVYNSNISMDKLVVEQLIAGPQDGESADNGFATIDENTQILSVTTQDGVCYVNLSSEFMIRKGLVTPEVAVYSIVNSLIELPGVNRVQISIDGDSEINYMETISLSQPLERNLEIMDNAQ